MIDNSKNPGFPAHWHARTYGLFSVNNLASKVYVPTDEEYNFSLNPGESMVFKHRILINTGSVLNDESMNAQFTDFNK